MNKIKIVTYPLDTGVTLNPAGQFGNFKYIIFVTLFSPIDRVNLTYIWVVPKIF